MLNWHSFVVRQRMMNRVFVLIYMICLTSSFSAFSAESIMKLRQMYYAAYSNEKATNDFLKYASAVADNGPTELGYNGVAEMMMCKHVLNPYTKLKLFYSGRDKLERAIAKAPTSVELRYLRYCVQQNVPGILNYSKNIKEDEQLLVRFVKDVNNTKEHSDLFRRINNYLYTTSVLPEN